MIQGLPKMDIGNYLLGIVKAVVPILRPWWIKWVYNARIIYPADHSRVDATRFTVSGKYWFWGNVKYVVFHQIGYEYYPQLSPIPDRTRKKWECVVDIGSQDPNKSYSIVLAVFVNEELNFLEDYFCQVHNNIEKNLNKPNYWVPFRIPEPQKLFHEIHRINVTPNAK